MMFGEMKVRIEAPDDLYFLLLPQRADSGKVMYELKTMIGTWNSGDTESCLPWIQHFGHLRVLGTISNRRATRCSKNTTTRSLLLRDKRNKTVTKAWKSLLNCVLFSFWKMGGNPSKAKGSRIVTEKSSSSNF